MRSNTSSRCRKWCHSAAAAWITTTATSTQNNTTCVRNANAFSTGSRPRVRLGTWKSPNHSSGKFAAELNSQPENGSARIKTYRRKCDSRAAARCHAGIGTSRGARWVSRHASLSSTSASTVRPMDLCSANTRTLVGVVPSSTMVRPIAPCTTISAAISQWNAWATLPQRASVLRSMVRIPRHGGFVCLLRILVEDGFDFQPHLHLRADRLRERRHAELQPVQRGLRRKAGECLQSREDRRADAVQRERDFDLARDAAQREIAAQGAVLRVGFLHRRALEVRDWMVLRVQEADRKSTRLNSSHPSISY